MPRRSRASTWSRIRAISGRDDDGRAAEDEGGELVAEALAAAGRGDEQEMSVVEQALDGLALAGAEGGVAQALEGGRQAGVPLGPGAVERAVVRGMHEGGAG